MLKNDNSPLTRFRIVMICFQRILECSWRQLSDTLVAASPMISMSFTRERTSMRLWSRSSRLLPAANDTASRAASSMCRSRMRSSCRILYLGRSDNFVPEISTQILGSPKVHFPSFKQIRKLVLQSSEAEKSRRLVRFKLYQDIDVALRSESGSLPGARALYDPWDHRLFSTGLYHAPGTEIRPESAWRTTTQDAYLSRGSGVPIRAQPCASREGSRPATRLFVCLRKNDSLPEFATLLPCLE